MTKLLIGYALAIGLWVGSVGFLMLALTAGDTLPENQLPITVALFSLAAVLIILPICLLIWSIRGIKNGTISKAGLGITFISGLYIAFLVYFVGGRILTTYIDQRHGATEQQMQIPKKLPNNR